MVVFLSFVIIIPILPILFILDYVFGGSDEAILQLNFVDIILGLVLAPLIETFIAQWLVVKLLRMVQFTKEKDVFIAFVSAIVFGIGHTFSVGDVFRGFVIGLLFAYSFILYEHKKKSPFWIVAAIHFVRNLISIILLIIVPL